MPCVNSKHSEAMKETSALMQKHKNAVVFRLSAMGDVVLLTGVLRYWHEEFGMRFIVVSRPALLDLFKNHPAVIGVYSLEEADLQGKAYREKCKALAQKYADYPLFDMHASTRSRLLASFWKNKVLRYNKLPIYRRIFLWTKGRFGSKKLLEKNVCQRYASLLSKAPACKFSGSNSLVSIYSGKSIPRELLAPQIYLSDQEIESAKIRLNHLFLDDAKTDLPTKKIIALHPFATHSSKTLPIQAWLSLAQKIAQKFKESHDVLWIGIGELPLTFSGKSLVSQTTLRELCGVLHQCDMIITGDSGPMHIANAVHCKIIALFGPTCEEWGFYPTGKNVEILQKKLACRPCSLHGAKPCSKKESCFVSMTHKEIIANMNKLLHE